MAKEGTVTRTCARRTICVLLLMATAASGWDLPASAAQVESAVACQEGSLPEPRPISFGAHTEGCAIDPSTDVDRFVFVGQAGDLVRLFLSEAGSIFIELKLEVIAPNGDTVVNVSPGGNILSTLELPQTGSYTVLISDNGADDTSGYIFQVERLLPPHQARSLTYDVEEVESFDPITDADRYTFSGVAGSKIRLVASEAGSIFVEIRIEVFDPLGESILDTSPGGNISADLDLDVTGTYSVLIWDNGGDDVGGYVFEVQCLVGSCPNGPPTSSQFVIEMPGSEVSSINGIGGWKCPQYGELTVVIDEHPPLPLAGRLRRSDTINACGNDGRNGFLAVINYANVGEGTHVARFFDNGVEFASRTFMVGTLGAGLPPFVTGLQGDFELLDFPAIGKKTLIQWKEGLQGFVILGTEDR